MENIIIRKVDLNHIRQDNGMIHPDGFGMILCTKGSGRLTYGNNVYTMEQNTLLVFTPYSVIHIDEGCDDMSGVLLETNTKTTLQLLSGISMEKRLAISMQPCVRISEEQARVILRYNSMMIEKQRDIVTVGNPTNEQILHSLAKASCLEILQIYDNGQKQQGTPISRNNIVYNSFIESVCANCHTQRTVTFYAARQNLSVGHFSMIVRNVSGHSPMYWIELFTMTAIKRLLRSSSLSIKEVADRMSFPDQSTFGRYFKEREGISPSVYKQNM